MAVRVKLRIKSRFSNRSLELVVLVNGGAESTKPCIVVDEATARELGLWPSNKWRTLEVEEASSISEAYVIDEAVELELLGDRGEVLSKIVADLVIQKGLLEPLITDITIDELGIIVMSFSKGLWRHTSDPLNIVRRSAM
ncbi:MAG: hypothetical protein LM567_01040 [Desulfurococcaceae archaeon]|nr:hypothetical protein [Desulfurococcaceae archaeon]